MSDFLNNYDWRAKVASMTEADDLDIEKAFSDMASGFVTNRVGDLMKDEHRIGFEIVKKNDDNTRMLGIFAFKIEKDLVFAPVFFLSGEIKGPLLYRCDNKRFVPANKDWASYLIEHLEDSQGSSIDKSKSRSTESRVAMDRLLAHPTKEASIRDAVVEEFGEDISGGIADSLLKQANSGILKEFLAEPDTGMQAAELLQKVASMDDSDEFVLRLADLYGDPKNLIPEKFEYTPQESKEWHGLKMVREFNKEAAANANQYWKDGFFLYDNRYLEDTCKIYMLDENADGLELVTDKGKYNIIKSDGSMLNDCFCIKYNYDNLNRNILGDLDHLVCTAVCGRDMHTNNTERILIIKDGAITCVESAIGMKSTDQDNPGEGISGVSAGNAYAAYVPGGDSLACVVYVIDKKTVDGVSYCKVMPLDHYDLTDRCNLSVPKDASNINDYLRIILNPDIDSNVSNNVYGNDAKFIKITLSTPEKENSKYIDIDNDRVYKEIKKLKDINHKHDHESWLFDKFKLPTVKITFNKYASYPYEVHDVTANVRSQGMTREEVLVKLAGDLSIKASDAYDIVDMAEKNGSSQFLYDGLEKLGMRIRIVGRPDWKDSDQSDTGLPKSEEQRFVLNIAGDQTTHEVPHIGDALNPTTATGLPNLTVATTDPDKLRGLADTYQLPHVFEHGVVATLADTFDANRLMDKYIPKLHEALDAIGRTLFLFYWKPDDFERQYGLDDMTNLEAQLESEFESFGSLTLNLAKKNDKQKAIDPEPGDIGE